MLLLPVGFFFFFIYGISANPFRISAGDSQSYALESNGTVFAWGDNEHGQLGDGTNTARSSPVPVNMTGVLDGKNIAQLASGCDHAIALWMDSSFHGDTTP